MTFDHDPTTTGEAMTTERTSGMAEQLERMQAQAKEQALGAMSDLEKLADRYSQESIAEALNAALRNLENDEFKVSVVGTFKHGKSTMLNALLAETTKPVELYGMKG